MELWNENNWKGELAPIIKHIKPTSDSLANQFKTKCNDNNENRQEIANNLRHCYV